MNNIHQLQIMKLQGSSLKKNILILLFVRLSQLVIDSIVRLSRVKKSGQDRQSKNKLLIIDTGAIGDFVILTGMLPGIREIYPAETWTIDIISSHQGHSIVKLLELGILGISSIVDSFIPIETLSFTRNFNYRFQFQQKLLKSHYDLVICPTFPRRLSDSQLLFIVSADRKIGINEGYICADLSQAELATERSISYVTRDIFQSPIPVENHSSNPPWISEIEKNAMLLKYLGISDRVDAIPKWIVPSILKTEATDFIKSYDLTEPFALICPGAFDDYRIWPPDKMSVVVDYLWSEYRLPVVICGGLAEKSISDEIQSHLKVAKAICICGKTSLIELTGLIANAKICIAMDSSPSHIAIAVGTPLISVVGGGHYQRFLPYGDPSKFRVAIEELDCFFCDWKCKFDRPICIEDIPIERVVLEINTLLN
jgi:ADP-heptose:LPS heptosyltransferase